MTKMILAATAFMLSLSATVHAEEVSSKNTISIQDVKPDTQKNKPKSGEDVDQIITNKKMRAESGSKSKWSIGSALTYYGGTVETPLKETRPNLAGGQGVTAVAFLGGQVGIGYKITTTDRLGFNAGVRWISPLQKNAPDKKVYGGQRVDIDNPNLIYSKIYRWQGVQSVLSVGPTLYTQSNLRQYGYLGEMTVMQNNIYEIGHSGLSVGLVAQADYNVFDKYDNVSKGHSLDWDIAVSPFLEYTINTTLNLRTVFNYAIFEHDRDAATAWTLFKNENTQSVGLGISVSRDIFLYPNLQFSPYNITHIFRADTTNVALAANINVF